MGLPVENVGCDNAGGNKKVEETVNGEKWKLNVNFEHAARATPQLNNLIETGFAIVLNKGRAIIIDANVPYRMGYKITQEPLLIVNKLDSLVVS